VNSLPTRGQSPLGTVPGAKGLSPKGTVPLPNRQRGYLLITVVVMLFLVASIATLLNHDSAISANTSSTELETARAEYVAQAGMQHALWRTENNACMGDMTIPATTLGNDNYTATISGAAAGTFYTLIADQDAWIRSDQPTTNKGGDSSLHIKDSQVEQPLYRFDLSSLPAGAQINFAVASFYVSGEHPEGPVTVHRITSGWNEGDVTWDSISGSVDSQVLAMIPAQPDNDVRVQVNITGQVQAWVNGQHNNGILLASSAPGIHAQYVSREGAPAEHPRLDVVVGSGPASPVAIQATGTLDNGVTRTLSRPVMPAYQPPSTAVLQLGTDPGADTMLDSFYPRNYGAQDFVQVNENTGDWVQRPVFKFALGGVPAGSRVLSAKLELRLRGIKTTGTATIHRLTRSWVEGTKYGTGTADGATWATFDGINDWTSAGGDFDAAAVAETAITGGETWVEWEIGPLVEQWLAGEPNDGLLIKSDGILEEAAFYSKEEADATLRPKLTITYACECGNACMAPQGSGNILMVVRDATNMWYYDRQKKAIFESWGYTVNVIDDAADVSDFDAGIAANDVAYISEPVTTSEIGTKLSDAAIGVVSDEGRMNGELGIASDYATPVLGKAINVSDTSHYITRVFQAGSLEIYSDAMEGLTVAGNVSPDSQTLADWGGAGSLVVLDAGMQKESGGSVAGRRVMLPFGRQVDSNVNWDYINGSGRLVVQRAIEWGMDANAGSSGKLLMVVADAGSPSTGESDRKSLIESWGYEVTLISDHALQAEFDAALANVDVAYITGSGSPADVNTKLTAATVGVLSEDIGLVDELGIAEPAFLKRSSQSINVIDNTHYVTDGFGLGTLQLYTYVPQIWTVTGALAPGLQVLGETQDGGSSYPTGLAVLDTGAELWGGGSAAGRRVQVAWSEGSFDINGLNADGQTIMQRAIEWASTTPPTTFKVLLIVGNATTLASKDVGYKALMESWGHTVAVLDDGASQADYDTAMAAADVVYASGSASGPSMLDKATYTTKGMVNEVNGKIDNFGFSSSTSATANFDTFSTTNAAHYITESFGGNPVTVFTSSLTNPIPGGTLAPDLQNVGQVSTTLVLGTLDAGATRYDSTPSQGRRVHLPLTSAETTDMTADGKVIMRRAMEWAAGAGSSQQEILLVVADATNLSAQDIARQTLMADWDYQVATISASDSQANFDAAVATASAAYVVMQNSSTALGTKLRDATIAVINEEVELRAEIGFAANRDWPTTRDTVDIIVDSHYITSPFSPGLLTIATAPIEVVTLSGQMAGGLLVLGQQDWGGLQNSLSVIDTGGALYGGGNAAGRRVQLPWGRVGFDINNLNADGLTIMRRAIEWGIAGGGGGGGGGSGTTVTLFPTKDTFVGGNSTAVYGGNTSLFMGFGSREWRPVLQFDVSGIPAGSTVTSAKLRLHNWDDGSASAGPLTVTAYGVEQAWTETWGNKGANWYDRAKQGGGALQWSTPGVSYSTGDSAIATFDSTAAPQWVEWEVAPLVQGWIDGASTNNGIVLVPDAGSAWANSRSADYGDAALHPQLVVTYE